VFLTARNLKKAEEACKSFLEPGRVELIEMDNNSLDSVRVAAKTFLGKSNKLNVLVNNAGIMAVQTLEKTVDGFESQFGTNHLAHFLFFMLLKDTLLASSTPEFNSRVVNVSSSGHNVAGVQFGNYSFEDGAYNEWIAYGQSKTANIYMANEIENRFGSQGLHGLSLHPGAILSGLLQHLSEDFKNKWLENPQNRRLEKSIEQGAATQVLAAVGKEFEGKGGIYLEDCQPTEPTVDGTSGYSPWAYDKEKEARLWEDSLKMVGLAGK